MFRVLLIDQSNESLGSVSEGLGVEFDVIVVVDPRQAKDALVQEAFDLVLIDHELLSGLCGSKAPAHGEVNALELRAGLPDSTVLFVLGRGGVEELVGAFEHGADDFIVRPFAPCELGARARARLRKNGRRAADQSIQDILWKAQLCFQVGRQRVLLNGEDLDLTPNEFKVLYLLAKHENKTLSRSEILHHVWGENLHVIERTVDKHVCSLRRKLCSLSKYLVSVPGQGYSFRASSTKAVMTVEPRSGASPHART